MACRSRLATSRHVGTDHPAHAGEDFALAIIEMLAHHGAVQIEIDAVERAGGLDAVDHRCGDALERLLGDMRRGAGRAGDGGNDVPAIGVRDRDETGLAGIDAAHGREHAGCIVDRGTAAAMHEGVVISLGRCKCIGLVQEAANRDARHPLTSGR
ncbi:hypothetical protein ACVIJ6_004932 [Bradyrhizobium sp. USDA 4369]